MMISWIFDRGDHSPLDHQSSPRRERLKGSQTTEFFKARLDYPSANVSGLVAIFVATGALAGSVQSSSAHGMHHHHHHWWWHHNHHHHGKVIIFL
jgi:hypothetical protein